jgi:uncharacterized RDD family membrane protein YckC
MTCPSCGGELVPGGDRCPVCDAGVAPRVEGALAADPRLVTPPPRPRARVEPLRDVPGLRKREKTWRDEVQERVRSRRQKRAEAGLPLFDQPGPPPPAEPPAAREARPSEGPPPPAPAVPEITPSAANPFVTRPVGARAPDPEREPDLVSTRLSEAELADLPLRAAEVGRPPAVESAAVPVVARRPVPSLDEDAFLGEADAGGEVEIAPPVPEPLPVERPARAAERAQSAAIDLLFFAGLAVLVVYFASRAARVGLAALVASWPGLVAYLGLLALFYAGYFTGTTGQTPGKLLVGLRVVGPAGRQPGYARAMARALVGLAGIACAGLGLLPMAFDPAARALHDRLLRTRVVRG